MTRFGDIDERTVPNLAEALGLLRACLATLPEPVAQRRLISAWFMVLNILVIHTRGDAARGESFDAAVADTLDQIELALEAPYRPGG